MSADSVLHEDALPPGTQLGDYIIDQVLGRGGFAITYQAHHIRLTHQKVAVKEYLPDTLARRATGRLDVRALGEHYRQGLLEFLSEGQRLASIRAPGVVRVVNYLEANSTAYLVLDFEAGATLEKRMTADRSLGERFWRSLAEGLLDALSVVHSVGLLHRDIKPSNIIVRPDDSPVLIDFGSARQDLSSRSGRASAIVSDGYSPPEQYTSDAKVQGPWTDLYALGATLYHGVTGALPVDASARVLAASEGDADPLSQLRSHSRSAYSIEFLGWIDWLMTLRRQHRPQSVEQARAQLARISTKATSSHPPSGTRRVAENERFAHASERRTEDRNTSPGQGRYGRTITRRVDEVDDHDGPQQADEARIAASKRELDRFGIRVDPGFRWASRGPLRIVGGASPGGAGTQELIIAHLSEDGLRWRTGQPQAPERSAPLSCLVDEQGLVYPGPPHGLAGDGRRWIHLSGCWPLLDGSQLPCVDGRLFPYAELIGLLVGPVLACAGSRVLLALPAAAPMRLRRAITSAVSGRAELCSLCATDAMALAHVAVDSGGEQAWLCIASSAGHVEMASFEVFRVDDEWQYEALAHSYAARQLDSHRQAQQMAEAMARTPRWDLALVSSTSPRSDTILEKLNVRKVVRVSVLDGLARMESVLKGRIKDCLLLSTRPRALGVRSASGGNEGPAAHGIEERGWTWVIDQDQTTPTMGEVVLTAPVSGGESLVIEVGESAMGSRGTDRDALIARIELPVAHINRSGKASVRVRLDIDGRARLQARISGIEPEFPEAVFDLDEDRLLWRATDQMRGRG